MSAFFVSSEVTALCRMCRSTLYGRTKPTSPAFDPDFPHPVKIGPRRNGWVVSEIEEYLRTKVKRRPNSKTNPGALLRVDSENKEN